MDYRTYLKHYPDKDGRFGPYGGAYLTEELKPAFEEINEAYQTICHSSQFINELRRIRKEFQGRPTPVYHCERLSREIGNCQIYLKREDLNHTGAHKLNHCMGEGLLAKFMGKKRLIAETGAGQHGVALATAAAFFGLECEIHMGEVDIAKQAPNVTRMKILGAKVVPVSHGLKTLKEAVDSAFESYAKNYKDSIYCIGSALGPHPFPLMVRDFQSVVGYEARDQFMEKGVMHGFESIMLKDADGEPAPVYSIASGLDYPSVGPEHAFLHDLGRVQYETVDDEQAMEAFFKLSRLEGIIPAIESSHAVAYAMRKAKEMKQGSILVCLSGRGDKDIDYVVEHYGYGEQFL